MSGPAQHSAATAGVERGLQTHGERLSAVVVVLVLIGAMVCVWPLVWVSPEEQGLRQAARALAERRFGDAERLAQAVLQQNPECPRAWVIAGEAAAGQLRSVDALAYFRRVKDDGGMDALVALRGAGLRATRLGRVAEAEADLHRVLQYDPQDVEVHEELAQMLHWLGRSFDALPHLLAGLQEGSFNGNRLLEMATLERPATSNDAFVEDCLQAVPSDPRPLLSRVRWALFDNHREHVEQLLRRIVAEAPGQLDSQALLGRQLLDSPDFLAWRERLPTEAGEHPEIWVTQGLWAKQHGQLQAAARCFWEAVRRCPDHQAACHQLGLALHALGDARQAQIFTDRAAKLNQLVSLFGVLADGGTSVQKIVDTLESLERNWEAAAWSHAALLALPDLAWAEQSLARLSRELEFPATLTPAAANPALRLDLSSYPLPVWSGKHAAERRSGPTDSAEPCQVRFEDVAAQVGLDFRYYNGADPQGRRAYMFEFCGGGIAVLDYDGDLWPDIYLTQGCPWPVRAEQNQYRDRLYRNLGNGQFADVTEAAGLGDTGMSQGVTAGDYDNDGFPDLYVGNIGTNRLYHNNGDGTFRDVTEEAGAGGQVWTASCLMADLNGDSWPDLYTVNYLAGPKVFELQCTDGGQPVQCAPQSFEPEQDQLFLNLGDGRFRDVTDECGIVAPGGKGLGIVAADFDGSRRLSLFVSNDTTANFFFVNRTDPASRVLQFEESALFSGLACDAEGRTQSCMGIAAGDANGDALLDLLVTNFHRESVAFYVQQPDHAFLDLAREAGLERPSYEMLSWGTQFLDGDLDGVLDLIVANGHLDDYRSRGVPYKMSPQYFRNRGNGSFAEIPGSTIGGYFLGQYLGRALVRLDWNRDGLEDFGTTHVDAPLALVTNRTAEHGNYLAVRLRGTASARDAIGTTLTISAGDGRWTRQLTAGDGVFVSNERLLILGLGPERRIQELTVAWPSGRDQRFTGLEANREVVLVEGRDEAWTVRIPEGRGEKATSL
jgi:tetratricopeptide (TPR) repeat protein